MPNAKVLESKKAIVENLSSKIGEATSVVFVNYRYNSVFKKGRECVFKVISLFFNSNIIACNFNYNHLVIIMG